jgi:hypothetical protein
MHITLIIGNTMACRWLPELAPTRYRQKQRRPSQYDGAMRDHQGCQYANYEQYYTY